MYNSTYKCNTVSVILFRSGSSMIFECCTYILRDQLRYSDETSVEVRYNIKEYQKLPEDEK